MKLHSVSASFIIYVCVILLHKITLYTLNFWQSPILVLTRSKTKSLSLSQSFIWCYTSGTGSRSIGCLILCRIMCSFIQLLGSLFLYLIYAKLLQYAFNFDYRSIKCWFPSLFVCLLSTSRNWLSCFPAVAAPAFHTTLAKRWQKIYNDGQSMLELVSSNRSLNKSKVNIQILGISHIKYFTIR